MSAATCPTEAVVAVPAVRHKPAVGAWLAFVIVCVVWGTTFLGIRIAIESIPTMLVTALRFTGAGIVLAIACAIRREPLPPTRREWIDQMVNGIVMVSVGNTLVVYAEHSIASGLAALLAATIPLWMAVLEAIVGAAPLTRMRSIGLAIGFGGVALLVAPGLRQPQEMGLKFFFAVLAMQLSGIAWNIGSLRSKRRPARAGALATAAIQTLSGGLVVGIVAIVTGETSGPLAFTTRSVIALVYLMLFGSVIAYTAFHYALRRLSAGTVALYAYVNPAVAVVLGALVLQEPLTLRIVSAMAIILLGVAVAQRSSS